MIYWPLILTPHLTPWRGMHRWNLFLKLKIIFLKHFTWDVAGFGEWVWAWILSRSEARFGEWIWASKLKGLKIRFSCGEWVAQRQQKRKKGKERKKGKTHSKGERKKGERKKGERKKGEYVTPYEERRRREKTFLLELGFLFITIVGFSFVVRRYVLFLCVSPLRQQVCGIFFRSRRCGFFG